MQRNLAVLALGLIAVAPFGARAQNDALSEMAETERAFARMSVDVGQREAFLAFFAEDGVVFHPGPVNARDFYRERPPTPSPQARVLDWEPAVGDVAASNDLGYSTGPFVVQETTSGKRLAAGWFFSVWRRQAGGAWRVVVDLGVQVPHELTLRPRNVERATSPRAVAPSAAPGGTAAITEEVRALDAAFADSVAGRGLDAYLARVAAATRVYRPGQPPAVGPDAIRRLLDKEPRAAFRAAGAGASAAGDFAYVYGSVETAAGDGGTRRQGGFVRVWRRLQEGWSLAAEVVAVNG